MRAQTPPRPPSFRPVTSAPCPMGEALVRAYGLSEARLYRIPHSRLTGLLPSDRGRKVWFTGRIVTLPVGGGDMAEFRFADDYDGERIYIRPWLVIPDASYGRRA